MSFSSRKLLTKIYDLDIPNESRRKKKEKDLLLFKHKLKSKKIIDKKKTFEINKTEKGNKIINKSKLKLDNSNKTIETNKFPVIPKLNIKNVIIKENNFEFNEAKEQKNMLLLDYNLIESSSEDSNYKLSDLKNGKGWQSERFCQYPQCIYIQFIKPVLIQKIEFILHEKNIPSIIRFYSYYPKDEKNNFLSNYKEVEYNLISLIEANSNENSNFKSREFRKIYPNIKSIFFKLEFDKNYPNMYNLFNQVGLIKLEFFGEYLDYIGGSEKNNELQINNSIKPNLFDDIDLIGICYAQLDELRKKMKYNIEIEDYMVCKEIKFKREKIRLLGKKLQELESEKTMALNNEDFSKVLNIKNSIDKIKIELLNIANSNSTQINDNNLFSDRYNNQKNHSKFIEPLSRSVPRKPKIYFLGNINNNNKNNNHTIDSNEPNSKDNMDQIDKLISNGGTILPKVFNKYNFSTEVSESIKEIEKGKLEEIPKEILDEYSDITNILGEENMQKIFSKQYLWKEEGLNILFDKIEDIIKSNNKNIKNIITSIFKLCLLMMEDTHPSNIIKIFEIIKKVFNYMNNNNKIKIKLENNITDGILYKIRKKLTDINIKVRSKAGLLYYFLISLNFFDSNNLIEDLIKLENTNLNKKSNNLILEKLNILVNLFISNDKAIKDKLTEKQNFPYNIIIEYLTKYMMDINHEIRKKTRFCLKLFFDIYDKDEFKKYFENINKKELDELIKDIPQLEKYFKINKNNEITEQKKDEIKIKEYILKKSNSKKLTKLNYNKNRSYILKSKEKNKNQKY